MGCIKPVDNFTHPVPHIENRLAFIRGEAIDNPAGRYPAPTRDWGYYSQMRTADKNVVERYLDKEGDLTAERPHVHVVHNPTEGRIIITATQRDGTHGADRYLPIDASGNEVNEVTDHLRGTLE